MAQSTRNGIDIPRVNMFEVNLESEMCGIALSPDTAEACNTYCHFLGGNPIFKLMGSSSSGISVTPICTIYNTTSVLSCMKRKSSIFENM